MKNILVCNQKGGVGKTMLADEIAFAFERDGMAINFYDLDGQGGCIHTGTKNEDAQISVIDTPGALQKDMPEWMKEADIIIIPTKPTTRDIEPLERTMRVVEENGIKVPVIYVINMANSYRASKDFEEWFTTKHPECKVMVIPQSELFIQAAAEEKSVVEFKKNSVPAEKIKLLTGLIKYELGIKQ